MSQRLDVIGKHYGRLTIIADAPTKPGQQRRVVVLCACGNQKIVVMQNVLNGYTQSCGCIRKEQVAQRSTTHGLSRRPEFFAWYDMIARCHDATHPSFANYGARGIAVCARWRENIAAFIEDLGPRPSSKYSLDRVDNDGPYAPDNCRWATRQEQALNTRKTRWVSLQPGIRAKLVDVANQIGMKPSTLYQRLRSGWSVDKALSQPVRQHR